MVLDRFFAGADSYGNGGVLRQRILDAIHWESVSGEGGRLQTRRPFASPVCAGMMRVLFAVLSETTPRNRCASGPALWQGRWGVGMRRRPAKLAAQAGVSCRQLQRYVLALKRSGVLRTWQPPWERTCERLRGRAHAYAVYYWRAELPARVVLRLQRWAEGWVRKGRDVTPDDVGPYRPPAPEPCPYWEAARPPPDPAVLAKFSALIPV